MDLELNIISATDLTKPNPFTRLCPYVVVSISGETLPAQKTPVDAAGGSNPTWNHPLRFLISGVGGEDLRVRFQIRHRSVAADKTVGEVCVPLRELVGESFVSGEKIPAPGRFVSYQVKKASGRPNGALTFSFKIGGRISGDSPPVTNLPAMGYTPENKLSGRITGVLTSSNKLNNKISGELPPVMNFPANPHNTTMVYPTSEDVYPPAIGYPPAIPVYPPPANPPSTAYPPANTHTYSTQYPVPADVYPPPPAVNGYNSGVYPPAAKSGQTGYGHDPYGSEYRYVRGIGCSL